MVDTSAQISKNVAYVRSRIEAACKEVDRDPSTVRLLPVSKTKPVELILAAYEAGCEMMGENRVQEMVKKQEILDDKQLAPGLKWSIIGPLQSNKAKLVATYASEFQAVESVKIARVLDNQLQKLGRSMDVMIEVNTSSEKTKFGIDPEETVQFAKSLEPFKSLNFTGLMTIATLTDDQAEIARCFRQLRQLQQQLRDEGALGSSWDELSMGMSGDYELAIKEGATVVRVGSLIFGERD